MADRVFPSSSTKPQMKPNGAAPVAANGGAFPPPKSQAYRPAYHPQPPPMKRGRRSRSCCCSCCLWLTFLIAILVLLVAIAVGVSYVIYRPQRPSFDVTGIRIAAFDVTASDKLASRIDINVTAHNPNKKLVYIYEPATISLYASQTGADIGDGSFPGFVAGKKNTKLLRASLAAPATALDATVAADLKKSKSLTVDVEVDTKAGVKIGGFKTKKIGIKVRCSGITLAMPKGKSPAIAAAPKETCKVKLRIKIWKWNI